MRFRRKRVFWRNRPPDVLRLRERRSPGMDRGTTEPMSTRAHWARPHMSRASRGVALGALAALLACLLLVPVCLIAPGRSTMADNHAGSRATTRSGRLIAQGRRASSPVPLSAQGPISAAIGRGEPAYWVRGGAAANPSQHLGLRFTKGGVV